VLRILSTPPATPLVMINGAGDLPRFAVHLRPAAFLKQVAGPPVVAVEVVKLRVKVSDRQRPG